jgi:hypothetical protein
METEKRKLKGKHSEEGRDLRAESGKVSKEKREIGEREKIKEDKGEKK